MPACFRRCVLMARCSSRDLFRGGEKSQRAHLDLSTRVMSSASSRAFSRVQLFVCGLPSLPRAPEESITRGTSINIPCAIASLSCSDRAGHVEHKTCRDRRASRMPSQREAAPQSITDRGRSRRRPPEPSPLSSLSNTSLATCSARPSLTRCRRLRRVCDTHDGNKRAI